MTVTGRRTLLPSTRPRAIADLAWAQDLCAAGFRLRRSWPRAQDHLLLELIDDSGTAVAGQWFADPERVASVVVATPGSRRLGPVVLQPDGADRKLRRLPELLSRPGHRLVAHRPERRAVVETPAGFLKLVRRSRHAEVLDRARTAAALGLGAPGVLAADAERGTVLTAPLPGTPLIELLSSGDTGVCTRVGQALARLHRTDVPAGLAEHGPDQELRVVARWTGLGDQYGLPQPESDSVRLPALRRRTLIHRDFHDGQLLVDRDRIGVLDFDLMAVGDPALDLANFLAHLELRGAQGRLCDPYTAIGATLDGYRPDGAVLAALPGYLAAARIRLRAVYAFRDPELPS